MTGRIDIIDQRTFERHREKTQQAIRKLVVRFEPHARLPLRRGGRANARRVARAPVDAEPLRDVARASQRILQRQQAEA
jgi:hypothetical protein